MVSSQAVNMNLSALVSLMLLQGKVLAQSLLHKPLSPLTLSLKWHWFPQPPAMGNNKFGRGYSRGPPRSSIPIWHPCFKLCFKSSAYILKVTDITSCLYTNTAITWMPDITSKIHAVEPRINSVPSSSIPGVTVGQRSGQSPHLIEALNTIREFCLISNVF